MVLCLRLLRVLLLNLRDNFIAGLNLTLWGAQQMAGTTIYVFNPDEQQSFEGVQIGSEPVSDPMADALWTVLGSIQDSNYVSSHTPFGEASAFLERRQTFDIDYPYIGFLPYLTDAGEVVELTIDHLIVDQTGNVYKQNKDPENVQQLNIFWLLSLTEPIYRKQFVPSGP